MKKTIKLMAMLLCLAAMGAMVSCKDDDKDNESSAEARAYAQAAVGVYDGYLDIAYTFNGEEINHHYDGSEISLSNPGAQKISITVPEVNGMAVTVNGWFNNDGTIFPENIMLSEQNFGATIQSSTLKYNKETKVLSGDVSMVMKDLNENVTASAVASIYGQKR
ncbi:MAG: hypothetical protein J5677_01705 [Bacteroidales bacterium]|nr:hypothetical protein [Bacteroidales bacterium]